MGIEEERREESGGWMDGWMKEEREAERGGEGRGGVGWGGEREPCGGEDVVFAYHSRSMGEHGTGAELGHCMNSCMYVCMHFYLYCWYEAESVGNEQGRCG